MPVKKKQREELRRKRMKQTIVIAGLIFVLLVIFNFYQGHLETEDMDKQLAQLEQDINQLEENNNNLREQIKQINSKKFIEEVAREELGLVKEGELLYITVEEDK